MCVVAVKVPDEVILDLHETRTDFSNYIKSMVAVDLYKNKKVSLGYCAEVAESLAVFMGKDVLNLLQCYEFKEFDGRFFLDTGTLMKE